MTNQEKQALTPEEFLTRKGDASSGGKESPCGDTTGAESVRAVPPISYPNGSRPALNGTHTTADATPHA